MERRIGCAVLAFSLAACSGTSNGSIPRATTPDSTHTQGSAVAQSVSESRHRKRVKVRIRVHFPKHGRRIGRKLRHHFDQSASTQGIETSIYDSSNNLLQKSAADISLGSTDCPGNAAQRICTYQVASPPGNNLRFVFRTYDQPPNANGNIPAAAAQIGAGVVTGIDVTEGTNNLPPIDIGLGGVLASIGLAVSPSSMHTLIQTNATLQVYARDADGNAIIGNYVDNGGNAVGINFSSSNNSFSFSPSSITSPQTTGILVQGNTNYSGNGGTQTIHASPGGGSAPTANIDIGVVDPTLRVIGDGNLNDTSSFFGGMAYVPVQDAVYYTYRAGNGGISEYVINSGNLSSYPAPASITGGLAYDSVNGDLVVTGPNNIYTMDYAGNYTPQVCGLPCAGAGSGVALASSDAWYGNGTNLIQSTYSVATPAPVGGTISLGIAIDNTGAQQVWMANAAAGGNVIAFNPTNAGLTSVAMPNGEGSFDVMKDGQGKIWVTTSPLGGSSGHLVEIDPNTQTVVYTLSTNYGAPRYIVQDPVQPNVYWYDFYYYGNTGIGRLDTLAGTNNQYQFGCCFSPGEPGAIAAADGYVFVVVDGTSQMVQVSP